MVTALVSPSIKTSKEDRIRDYLSVVDQGSDISTVRGVSSNFLCRLEAQSRWKKPNFGPYRNQISDMYFPDTDGYWTLKQTIKLLPAYMSKLFQDKKDKFSGIRFKVHLRHVRVVKISYILYIAGFLRTLFRSRIRILMWNIGVILSQNPILF